MSEELSIIKCAVVTVSDTRTLADDLSGEELTGLLTAAGARVVRREIVSDDLVEIREKLIELSDVGGANIILTTGGTGFGPRDNTPEATRSVIEKEAPGLAEAMRRETARSAPMAILSRSVAGIRTGTLIINLPGSPKGVRECFGVIRPVLGHAIALLTGSSEH